jgi:hypothetical protein
MQTSQYIICFFEAFSLNVPLILKQCKTLFVPLKLFGRSPKPSLGHPRLDFKKFEFHFWKERQPTTQGWGGGVSSGPILSWPKVRNPGCKFDLYYSLVSISVNHPTIYIYIILCRIGRLEQWRHYLNATVRVCHSSLGYTHPTLAFY